jgi:hypothetical protein
LVDKKVKDKAKGLIFLSPKVHWSRTLLVLNIFLLVLNIGMEEIKFVDHKINLPPSPSGHFYV